MQNKIFLYTDGACRGNGKGGNNIGAWGYCLVFGQNENAANQKTDSGHAFNTTNNKMELTAVIEGLKAIKNKTGYTIEVYSDSEYVVKGVTQWSDGWVKKNWKNVKNVELWQELLHLLSTCADINFHHVLGHSGVPLNELVDRLCNETMDKTILNS